MCSIYTRQVPDFSRIRVDRRDPRPVRFLLVQSDMDADLEDLVARASDPRWIPCIYNYCDRRCARCRFNDRCFAFSENLRERNDSNDLSEVLTWNHERTVGLIKGWADRAGIDLEALAQDEDGGEASEPDLCFEDDPLVVAARDYALTTCRTLRPLDTEAFKRQTSLDAADAIDSVLWLCTMIPPKIHRALSGLVDVHDWDDPVQNDAHGSAKIARLMIADSLAAWRVINGEGRAPDDALTRKLSASLDTIDQDLTARLPRAMEFVRPGFDERCPGTVRPWSVTPEHAEPAARSAGGGIVARMRATVADLLERLAAGG